VAFRLTQAAETVVPARVTRETPQALAAAPAAALSAAGGGPILTAPSGGARERPVQQFFEIELAPLAPVPSDLVGARVFARFDHGAEPLGFRLWRATRQVFLAALGV
jgi:putative peptide zinc metalloprotease protein